MVTPLNGLSARIILCDFAQATPDGKLTLVGAGWSFINPGPGLFGVGIMVELDQSETGKKHTWELVLRDADGRPVNDPKGNPVRVAGGFLPQHPPADFPAGMPVKAGIAWNFAGLPLPPASRFQLVLVIDNSLTVVEDFSTRPAQTPQLKAS
jgi:hypothetical protein